MMLAQFQSLYPQGSLISELLQIHNGKHIVRVTIQIEGTTRATGMAASETIEKAEDHARERALSLLSSETLTLQVAKSSQDDTSSKVENNQFPQTTTDLEEHDTSTSVSISTNIPTEVKEANHILQTLQSDQKPDKKENLTNLSRNQITEEQLSPIPLDSLYSSAASKEEGLLPETSKTSNDSDFTSTGTSYSEPELYTSPPVDLNETSEQSSQGGISSIQDATGMVNPLGAATSVLQEEESTQKVVDSFNGSNEEKQLSLISSDNSDNLQSPLEQNSEPLISESQETPKATKKKTTTSKRKKKTEPVDDSDTIAKIGVEMKRLGWTIEDGREHLRKTYNKISRHLLAPEELQDFLRYLESQEPASLEPLPLDPNF